MPSRPRSPPDEIDPVRFKKSVETSAPFSTTRIRPACSTTNCRELLVESWRNATGEDSPETYTRPARFDCAATLGPRTTAAQTITTATQDRSNCMIGGICRNRAEAFLRDEPIYDGSNAPSLGFTYAFCRGLRFEPGRAPGDWRRRRHRIDYGARADWMGSAGCRCRRSG